MKSKTDPFEVLVDPPIKSRGQDRLGRCNLAEKVAQMLLDYNGDESFVVGIEGEWGSGKTSFIEMVLETLRESKNKPDTICFNPWNFSNPDNLYLEFFTLLGEALGEKTSFLGYAKKIYRTFDSIIEFDPKITIPGTGISVGKWRNKSTSFSDLRKDIEKKLLARNKKIVIVIDDIDRLDRDETRAIFKLIKVNANFPNVIFLIAYDRSKVEIILNDSGFPGAEYLKKIVQVSFSLPEPQKSQLYKILFEEIDNTLDSKKVEDNTKKYWDDKRWGNLFHAGYKNLFNNIRDIKRYVSSWKLDYLIIGYDEVNPVDFLGTELIRVLAPDFYAEIGENKELFTGTDGLYIGGRDDKDSKKAIFDELIKKAPENTRDSIRKMCYQLFPQVSGLFNNESFTHDWQVKWKKDLRVCSQDVFDKYFLLSVPEDDLTQSEFKSLVKTLSNPTNFAQNILKIESIQKRRNTLDLLQENLDQIEKSKRLGLLLALFDIGEQSSDERLGMMDIETIDQKARRLQYHILMRESEPERAKILKDELKKTKTIYSPMFLIGYLYLQHKDLEEKKEEEKPLISNKQDVEELLKTYIDKIRTLSKTDALKKHPKLGSFIIWWYKYGGNEKQVRDYLKNYLKTKRDLLILLKSFKHHYYSQSFGDYVSTTHYNIDIKGLDEMIGLDNIKKAVEKHFNGKLSKEEKEIEDILNKSIEGKTD